VPPHRGALPRRLIGRPPEGAHCRYVGVFTVLRGRSRHFPAIVNHLRPRGEAEQALGRGDPSSRRNLQPRGSLSTPDPLLRREDPMAALSAGCRARGRHPRLSESSRVNVCATNTDPARVPSSAVLSCLSPALSYSLFLLPPSEGDVVDVVDEAGDQSIVDRVPCVCRTPEVHRCAITPARCHAERHHPAGCGSRSFR
jgi:hypothetical protein